jgi:hypothetical protein
MPPVNRSAGDYLLNKLKTMEAQIGDLQRQQNWGILDGSLHRRIFCGLQEDGKYSLQVFDNASRMRVALGELPGTDDYGLSVVDVHGNTEELLPAVADYVDTSLTITSTTPSAVSGSPTVTVVIGASGDCKITAGAYIGVPSGDTGIAYLVVDGDTPWTIFNLGGTGAAANVQSTRRWKSWRGSGLTPNTAHTFTMHYASVDGSPVTFAANYLEVQPI